VKDPAPGGSGKVLFIQKKHKCRRFIGDMKFALIG